MGRIGKIIDGSELRKAYEKIGNIKKASVVDLCICCHATGRNVNGTSVINNAFADCSPNPHETIPQTIG